MTQKIKIASFGEIVWDVYKDEKTLGGAPLNFAYYCKESGADAKLISAIGEDDLGREAVEIMRQCGISTDCVSDCADCQTGRVQVSIDASGQPKYEIEYPSAWDFIEPNTAAMEFIAKADAIAFGTLAQRSEKSRASLHAILRAAPPTCMKVFDINLRQNYYSKDVVLSSLELSNTLKLNDEELPVVAKLLGICGEEEDMAAAIYEHFKLSYLILTKGAAGHIVISDRGKISAQAMQAEVVDTVGAGDAFTATFVTDILSGASPAEASEAASTAAAKVVSQRGALVSL